MTEHAPALALLGSAVLLALAASAASRRKKQRVLPSPGQPPPLLAPLLHLLGRTPFDRRNPAEQRRIVEFLKRIDAETTAPAVHAKIHLLLAEMALVTGDREQAQAHFRAALGWDPQLPVRRTLERLETPVLRLGSDPRAA